MTAIPPFARRSGLVAILAAGLVAGACGPEPSSSPEPAAFDGRLLIFSGRPEPVQLAAVDGRGVETAVTIPDGGLRWFAAAADGHLAGVEADGEVVVLDGDDADWRTMPLDEVPAGAATADVRLPGWSADGRLAVVFGVAETARISGVLVVDPATELGQWIALDAGLGGYPPAWLDPTRLAVPTRDKADRPTITVLVADTGAVGPVVADARAIAASSDASTLAVLAGDGLTLELWHPDDWLRGDATASLGRWEVADPLAIDAFALDRTGERLAIGSSDPTGGAAGLVRVLDGTIGWAVVRERSIAAGAPIGALGFVP